MKEKIHVYPISKSPGVYSTNVETPNVYVEPPFLLAVGDSVAGDHVVYEVNTAHFGIVGLDHLWDWNLSNKKYKVYQQIFKVFRHIIANKGTEFLQQTPNFLIPQAKTFLSNIIHSLKYQRSTTSGCKDLGIKTFEFVAKTHLFIILSILPEFFSSRSGRNG